MCFTETRAAELVEYSVSTMVTQRVIGIALGYEETIEWLPFLGNPVSSMIQAWIGSSRA
jgi:hypothetical protein